MIVVYSTRYHIDIGTHVFPTRKYHMLHDRIRASGVSAEFVQPSPASWEHLALVHSRAYLEKLQTGVLDASEIAQLELPWSFEMIEGFRLMTGGTIAASQRLLASGHPGVAFHIGGGFHHAFASHGEGFCVFNDVAVAIRLSMAQQRVRRATVIDLDVHHGNGTAFIFENEPGVFTFSMHQQNNYPAFKPKGSLDIGLPDGAGDAEYLEQLGQGLEKVVAFAPDIAFYLAGADPYKDDQLGGLALTKAGLRERDRLVLRACTMLSIPLVVVLAGGYAHAVEDTIDIHHATFEESNVHLASLR
ncbi:MAG: histone deacetylase [Acidobacteria bacterium]|nr:histone deacetylase [Acidobacteriota bacterium]